MKFLRFREQTSGDEVPMREIGARVDASIAELASRLSEAIQFRQRLLTRTLRSGDEYLDFDRVLENGYDRTGPEIIMATEYVKRGGVMPEFSISVAWDQDGELLTVCGEGDQARALMEEAFKAVFGEGGHAHATLYAETGNLIYGITDDEQDRVETRDGEQPAMVIRLFHCK